MITQCNRRPKGPRRTLVAVCLTVASNWAHADDAIQRLSGYSADLTKTSISGVSSGGFMAAQFEVAYSRQVVGAGIVAGGPFFCAGSSSFSSYLQNATTLCMKPLGPGPNASRLYAQAQGFALQGKIDPLIGLRNHRVYLFSGLNDITVRTKVVDQTRRFLELAGVPDAKVTYIKGSRAGHALVTDNPGDNACNVTAPPYINNCGTEQSHDILRHIYGRLKPPVKALSGQIVAFDQREFIHEQRTSMSDTAYVYIPAACKTKRCKVHIAMHGCQQGSSIIGNRYYSGTGYNEIADTNRMIVLYPQVQASSPIPYNPLGCWDFWGYSSSDQVQPDFYSKSAPQLRAIEEMLERLGSPRQRSTSTSGDHPHAISHRRSLEHLQSSLVGSDRTRRQYG